MAVSYANQGIELDPDLAEAYAVLAMIHSVRYEYEEAQAALDRYFSLPDNDIHWFALALPTGKAESFPQIDSRHDLTT